MQVGQGHQHLRDELVRQRHLYERRDRRGRAARGPVHLQLGALRQRQGRGQGTFEEGLKRIKHLLPHKIDEAWAIAKENCVHADNAGGYSCLVEIESMEGETTRYLFDTGWNYDWMDTCFKREGIDVMLADNKIDAFYPDP